MKTIVLALAALLLLSASAPASPIKGPINGRTRFPYTVDVDCLANQPTAALAMGEHLEVIVYEVTARGELGAVVGRDQAARNLAGVVWTPARTAKYRVVIQNSSSPESSGDFYRSIK